MGTHINPGFKNLIYCLSMPMLIGMMGSGAWAANEISRHSCYVDPRKGSDSNSGTITAPWQTLAASINKLRPGDTLFLRGGKYLESNVRVSASGTLKDPITIKNYKNEAVIIDGGFVEFRKTPNSDWEAVDGTRAIYRSRRIFNGMKYAYGYFGPDNENFRLIAYESYNDLASGNQDYSKGPTYLGPGVFFDPADSRIYIRLQPGKYEHMFGCNVPVNQNPCLTNMFIFSEGPAICFTPKAAHMKLEGLDIRYRGNAVEFESGAHDIALVNVNALGGRAHILVRDGSHDLLFDGVSIIDRLPPWMPRSDVKYPKYHAPGHRMQGAGFMLSGSACNIEIRNCIVRDAFDAIDATTSPHGLHIHHNQFSRIRDDGVQLGSAGYDIEIDHNRMTHVSCGISWNGSGRPPADKTGTKYIHHNIIDASQLSFYLRDDPGNLLDLKADARGPAGDGMTAHRAIGMHTRRKITGPDPWKIYQNTFMVTKDYLTKRGIECAYFIEPFDPRHPHEVYNNIFIQVGDHWITRNARTTDGSQIFDGNLYYRSISNPEKPLFKDFWFGRRKASFQSLAEFKNSSIPKATRSYYAPGWESAGVEGDPRLDRNYRPAANGPAAAGAVPLPAEYPGNDGQGYRGALPPLEWKSNRADTREYYEED